LKEKKQKQKKQFTGHVTAASFALLPVGFVHHSWRKVDAAAVELDGEKWSVACRSTGSDKA